MDLTHLRDTFAQNARTEWLNTMHMLAWGFVLGLAAWAILITIYFHVTEK